MSDNTSNTKKIKVLVCTDGPTVNTGFGRVNNEIMTRLAKTGKYTFIFMATNDRGEYHPLRGHPDFIIEPLPFVTEDPYGFHRLPELLDKYEPDMVFALNDIWVLTADERRPEMLMWFAKRLKAHKPYIPFIVYFPVDGRPWAPMWAEMVNYADYGVVYSDYGQNVMANTPGINMDKVRKIYHGSSCDKFFPLPKEEKDEMKKAMGVEPDTFLMGIVSRNQPRKSIPRAIQVYKMFKDGYVICRTCGYPRSAELSADCECCGDTSISKIVPGRPNCALYLHMNVMDMRGFKLPKIIADNRALNVITRPRHNVAEGVPIEELNRIYNALDVLVHPTLAGGFELPVIEAQAAGTPVVGSRTTSVTELLENGKGYMCMTESPIILEDANHCHKHLINTLGLLNSLEMAYQDWLSNNDRRQSIISKGIEAAKIKNWDTPAQQFDKLFTDAASKRQSLHEVLDVGRPNVLFTNETNNLSNCLSMLPAIQQFADLKHEAKVVLALRSKMLPIAEGLSDVALIDVDKMWLDKRELSKYNLSMNSIEGVPTKYENGTIPKPEKNWIQIFCEGLGLPYNPDIPYQVTDEEKEFASSVLKLDENKNKFKVLMLTNTFNANNGLAPDVWSKSNTFLGKYDDILRIVVGTEKDCDMIDGDIKIACIRLRQIIALASVVECIVTSDDSYLYLANILPHVKMVFICSHRKHQFNLLFDNVEFVTNESRFPCAPCWKSDNNMCRMSGSNRARCHDAITHSEIFNKILRVKKALDKQKMST